MRMRNSRKVDVGQKLEVMLAGRNLLELAELAILADPVPGETFAVHGNVNSRRQRLHE